MRSESRISDIICYTLFLVLITSKMCQAGEDFDDAKEKRAGGGSVGLFPFPRVGRSDPDMLSEWDLPLSYNSLENYDDLGRQEMKRQGLVAFPRVGRSGGLNPRFLRQQLSEYNKRTMSGASPSSHMWFGPRLGKRAHDQGEQF